MSTRNRILALLLGALPCSTLLAQVVGQGLFGQGAAGTPSAFAPVTVRVWIGAVGLPGHGTVSVEGPWTGSVALPGHARTPVEKPWAGSVAFPGSAQQPGPAPASPAKAGVPTLVGIVDVGSTLRVRAYPWGPVIGGLRDGDQVQVLGISGDFYAIAYQGRVAYVHRRYVGTDLQAARQHPVEYPSGCAAGGHLPPPAGWQTPALPAGLPGTAAPTVPPSAETPAAPTSGGLPAGVGSAPPRGQTRGDGTPLGAVAWGLDQLAGGQQKGRNSNNGLSSSRPDAWNNWCLAFVATAYGRRIPDLAASTAYNAYRNCRRSGRPFHRSGTPPAGAVFFTGPTASNSAGHVFLATGEITPDGDPYVLTTTGWGGQQGIQRMPLQRMLGMLGGEYLGWTPMP